MLFKRAIEWGIKQPGKLFLIDGSGAVLSAFLLGVVLVESEYVFGIPRRVLYVLAVFPCIFAVFDFYCYRAKSKKAGGFLMAIAFLNIAYCILSAGLAIYHFREITCFGLAYLTIEIFIVMALATLEWKVATSSRVN